VGQIFLEVNTRRENGKFQRLEGKKSIEIEMKSNEVFSKIFLFLFAWPHKVKKLILYNYSGILTPACSNKSKKRLYDVEA
jgi:hypothetical protein